LFPILESTDTPEQQVKKIKKFTKFIGQHIKKYAKSMGIEKNINSKIARHSFATTSILMSKSMEFNQDSMGHSIIKTTHNYFAGFDDETKKEFAHRLMDL